jgi:argininosuccinate lyase
MKLWDKGQKVNDFVEHFTVGNDREMDIYLARFDVLGSMAHTVMLKEIGILLPDEAQALQKGLKGILQSIDNGRFAIEEGIEDIHSQVEHMLTQQLGDVGKKIHSGRSRNDQVLVDLRLFLRQKCKDLAEKTAQLFHTFLHLSEQHKAVLMPGYTHFQVAMPSSFGLWFGAYAESLADDMVLLQAAYTIINQNPLGSAAGYGTSFPLNRETTTRLLGFNDLSYNVVYAQMGRGKTEKTLAMAMSSLAATLSKFAMDATLFMGQNHNFIGFPEELTTGSSIMPHKKNPDMFELVRAKCNRIQNVQAEIAMVINNLPSGYHRDFQLLKESLFPAIGQLEMSMGACQLMLENIKVNTNILDDERYQYMFSVEEVNKLVLQGKPFRDAYHVVGQQIQNQQFRPEKEVSHTHQGSIGNLCNDKIALKFENTMAGFNFGKFENALRDLINS